MALVIRLNQMVLFRESMHFLKWEMSLTSKVTLVKTHLVQFPWWSAGRLKQIITITIFLKHKIFTCSMFDKFECIAINFSLSKAILEIQEDLKSEAIWRNFHLGPDSKKLKFYSRAYFHVWNKNYVIDCTVLVSWTFKLKGFGFFHLLSKIHLITIILEVFFFFGERGS